MLHPILTEYNIAYNKRMTGEEQISLQILRRHHIFCLHGWAMRGIVVTVLKQDSIVY